MRARAESLESNVWAWRQRCAGTPGDWRIGGLAKSSLGAIGCGCPEEATGGVPHLALTLHPFLSGHWPLEVFLLSRAYPLKPCVRIQERPFNCCIFHHLANISTLYIPYPSDLFRRYQLAKATRPCSDDKLYGTISSTGFPGGQAL